MSIQTDLTRIKNAKAAIKAAIEGKGVTVPDATLLDGMAALIESIEAGGGIAGYQVISGSYSPTEDITSSVQVYETAGLTSSGSEIETYRSCCVAITFFAKQSLDSVITYPTHGMSVFAIGNSSVRNFKNSSTSSSLVIKHAILTTGPKSGKYGLGVYLGCSSTYPLKAGNTYMWMLLVPNYIPI